MKNFFTPGFKEAIEKLLDEVDRFYAMGDMRTAYERMEMAKKMMNDERRMFNIVMGIKEEKED